METYFYAQLDENGVCVGVSQLSGEVDAPHMLRLTEAKYGVGLLGRAYRDGAFAEGLPEAAPDEEV